MALKARRAAATERAHELIDGTTDEFGSPTDYKAGKGDDAAGEMCGRKVALVWRKGEGEQKEDGERRGEEVEGFDGCGREMGVEEMDGRRRVCEREARW